MFDRDSIAQRIKDNLNSEANKMEGSFAADAALAIAQELEFLYAYLQHTDEQHYIDTAIGDRLDKKAKDYGLGRKQATKAIGTVTASGTDDVIIPMGRIFLSDTLRFIATTNAVIKDGTAEVRIEAEEVGAAGNVPVGAINKLEAEIQGITSVSNELALTGGTEIEGDESFRSRLEFKISNPATSGNKAHYKIWASNVPGVGKVKVFPLHDGPGTVKVSVLDANQDVASPELMQAVKDYIDGNDGTGEGVAPIGASLTVSTATEKGISVQVKIHFADEATAAVTILDVQTALKSYFKEISYHDKISYVSYAKIMDILFDENNVEDIEDLEINGDVKNIGLGEEEIPSLLELEVI